MVSIKQGTGHHGIQHTAVFTLPPQNPGSQSALNGGEEEKGGV